MMMSKKKGQLMPVNKQPEAKQPRKPKAKKVMNPEMMMKDLMKGRRMPKMGK